MQLRHTLVIAPEKSREILRQVFFVHLGQRADNAKVQRDIAPQRGWIHTDLDIARVHIGVEKTIAKHLGKKQRYPIARQLGDVHARGAQGVHLTNRQAVHPFHHQHIGSTQVPVHLRNQDQPQALHIAAQLRGAGGLSNQVQLVVQVFVKLGYHFARLEAAPVFRPTLDEVRHPAHERDILVHRGQHARTQHLDRNFAFATLSRAHHAKVHLRNRGTGHRFALEGYKEFGNRLAQRFFNRRDRDIRIKRRHPVL